MNIRSIASAATVAVMTFALAAPATVLAGERNHGNRGGGHQSSHNGGHQNKHHYKRNHRGRGSYNNNYYRKDNHDDLLIGLVVGGILGYAVNSAQQQNDISYDRYPDTRRTYPVTNSHRHNDNSCLQEREYQTTVIVGGREVDAYGTACLQPDGSWKRSPVELASY